MDECNQLNDQSHVCSGRSDQGIEDALQYVGNESRSAMMFRDLGLKAQKEGEITKAEVVITS